MDFIEMIFAKAKQNKRTIVLPESEDIRTLKAAHTLTEQELVNVILIGKKDDIFKQGKDLDLSKVKVIDPKNFDKIDEYAKTLYELRQHKGMTEEEAKELIVDPLYFGIMLVKMNQADGMVAGAVNSTADTLRPALQILKTVPGTKLVSGFFIIVHPDKSYGSDGMFAFGDCGVVEDPDSDQLSDIAVSTAKSFESLVGAKANVALLSYSTHGSARSPLTEKVVLATKLAQEKAPKINIDGEMQADAALVEAVSRKKAPESKVGGKANVLIFPDLNSGNIAYKLVERLGGASAYGPLLQGIAKPVNDLSRGCSAKDIVGVAAITAVQAIGMEK